VTNVQHHLVVGSKRLVLKERLSHLFEKQTLVQCAAIAWFFRWAQQLRVGQLTSYSVEKSGKIELIVKN
jgi:hypothetical protein